MLTSHLADGPGGRTLQYYIVETDTEADAEPGSSIPVIWFHGSPNVGEPPAPLFDAAAGHGISWIGYDRPNYGGSTANPGGTSHRPQLMWRRSPMPWNLSVSR
jgi:pimeloyl-ACP methyl ester carboxylesterase